MSSDRAMYGMKGLSQNMMGRNMMSSNMRGQSIYSNMMGHDQSSNMMGHQMSSNMMGPHDMTSSMMDTNMMGRNQGRGMHSMSGQMNAYTNNVNQLPLGQRNTMSQRMEIEQSNQVTG